MKGEFEAISEGNDVLLNLTPEGRDPVRLLIRGDQAHVTVEEKTSGSNVMQGQSGQTAASALRAVLALLMLFFAFGCASDDGMKGMGDAAAKATGGDASGRAGSIDSKIVGGYMPGDIESWDVKAQRNVTASKAGDVYSAVTVNAGSGAAAMREAIAADPVLGLIRDEIAALKNAERTPETTARMDALRHEMADRVKELETTAAKSSPNITIGDVHQELKIDSMVGKDPPVTTPADAEIAQGVEKLIGTAKGAESQPVK